MSQRVPIDEREGTGHPMKASIVLVVGVTVLIILLALASTF